MEKLRNIAGNYSSYGLDGTAIAIRKLSGMVTQQAMIMSFIDVFLILTALFSMLIVLAMLIKKPQAAPTGGGGGH